MKILVTGSSGFIGQHLCARLRAEGHEVTGFDIQSGQDVRRLAQLRHYMQQRHMVVHLAALNAATSTFYERPWEVLDVGVRGAMNVLEAAVREYIPHVIMVSSSEVTQEGLHRETSPLTIPDPTNPRFSYAASKIVTEVVALTCGKFDVKVIRPFNVYGPGQGLGHVIPDMIARRASLGPGQRVEVKGATEVRSFCHVSDFVEGFMLVMKQEGGIWNIGNDAPIRIDKLAEMIYSRAPARSTIDSIVALPGAAGAPSTRIPDITKLRALGYAPKVTLAEGLADLISRADAV